MSLEYQNIFTQVQVAGPPEMGMAVEEGWNSDRVGTPGFSKLAGWFGNAQLGPVHLGFFGVISLVAGALWPLQLLPSWLVGGVMLWAVVELVLWAWWPRRWR